MGALAFAFVDPDEARHWVDDYYETLKRECIPIGHAINPNIAMVTGFSCHEDAEEAARRGLDGFRFFAYALGHHYIYGSHKPGRTDIWRRFEAARENMPASGGSRGIGTPAMLRESLTGFAEAGVDQVIFIQQGGRNRHQHIAESLELFAAEVMPEFKAREAAREQAKMVALAPYLEQAMARKRYLPALGDDEIPEVLALGRQIVAPAPPGETTAEFGRGTLSVPLKDPAAGKDGRG